MFIPRSNLMKLLLIKNDALYTEYGVRMFFVTLLAVRKLLESTFCH